LGRGQFDWTSVTDMRQPFSAAARAVPVGGLAASARPATHSCRTPLPARRTRRLPPARANHSRLLSSELDAVRTERKCAHWRSQGGGARAPRNWVHKKIPGCAVELNTQNCAWFGSQISLYCYELSEPPTRGSAPEPRWGTSVPLCPPPPNPGYATDMCLKLL